MYKFRIESKKVPVKINSNLSLYEACKKTVGVNGGVVLSNGKLIAFFCSHEGLVKAGFGANPYEKEQVNNFLLGV
jgi:hypothetical protein